MTLAKMTLAKMTLAKMMGRRYPTPAATGWLAKAAPAHRFGRR
jgi:hypothetical protein